MLVASDRDMKRFWSKVRINPETGCWEWAGAKLDGGYARLSWPKNGKAGHIRAHRLAYEQFVGPIPEGKVLDHLCRVRHCVNPAHLEPVTIVENIMRGDRTPPNSRKTHCKHGHPLSPSNIYIVNGKR